MKHDHDSPFFKKKRVPGASDASSDASDKIPFISLRVRDFRLLFCGTLLSNSAQWIQYVTLSWLVYDITSSGTMLGSVNVVRSVATIGIIPVAGLLIDRFYRRNLMIMENAWLFVITITMSLILLTGNLHIAHLFIFTFLAGLAQSFDMSIRQVAIFDLVPRKYAPNAVSIIQTGWALTRSIGPGIGGFIILWIGAGGNFMVQASAYLLIAFTIYRITFPRYKRKEEKIHPIKNIREGFQYVANHRMTKLLMIIGWIHPFFVVPNMVALPAIYAKDIFHGGPETLGYLLSALGIGGFIGGIFASSFNRFERRGILQMGSLVMMGIALVCFSFCEDLWIALPFLSLTGFFEILFLASNQTLLQLSIPDELRGRVTSIINLNTALPSLGSFIAGMGADFFGTPKWVTVISCGFAAIMALVVLFRSPTIRDYRLSQAISESISAENNK